MSSIDKYKHTLLGFVNCPASSEIILNNNTRKIAIYELLEDVFEEDVFDGFNGDILVGGGSGEAPALRISKDYFKFLSSYTQETIDDYSELCKAFWTPTESYILCEGFSKLGWSPKNRIENWLAERVCVFLIRTFEKYSIYGNDGLPKNSNELDLSFFEKAN